jgi:hypothetical protein
LRAKIAAYFVGRLAHIGDMSCAVLRVIHDFGCTARVLRPVAGSRVFPVHPLHRCGDLYGVIVIMRTFPLRFHALALAALSLAMPGAASAADKFQLVDGSANLRARTVRLQLARELAAEIGGVVRRIAAPSAAEQAMLASEIAAIDRLDNAAAVNTRARQLYLTPRFQEQRLRETLQRVSEALHCAAEKRNPASREMTCWAIAAFHLNDRSFFEEAISVLRTTGHVPRDGDTSAGKWSSLHARFNLYGRAIQQRIVIPYLAGELR